LRAAAKSGTVFRMTDWNRELFDAIARGDVRALKDAIARGADLGALTPSGETALMRALLARSSLDCALVLVQLGADINQRGGAGRTALHIAAARGADAVELLLAAGARKDARDDQGLLPLDWVPMSPKHFPAAKLLAKTEDGRTDPLTARKLLARAVLAGDTAAVLALIQQGASLEAQQPSAPTPLHLASQVGSAAVVEALLRAGAALEAETSAKERPLHVAAFHGHPEVLRLLLRAGAQHGARECTGQTPLHRVAVSPSAKAALLVEAAGVLLEAGATAQTVDIHGYSPRLSARAHGNFEVLARLPAEGGEPPLDESAREVRSAELVRESDFIVRWYPHDLRRTFEVSERHGREEYGKWMTAKEALAVGRALFPEPERSWFLPFLRRLASGQLAPFGEVAQAHRAARGAALVTNPFRRMVPSSGN
jgi:ankyrin repeat protein